MEDKIREIKLKVAKLMMDKKRAWELTYRDREPTPFEKETYKIYADEKDYEIKMLIPESEKLTIELTGCAKGDLSHYDIELSLREIFKEGEGIQYDSEGGQFWVYVKPTLVQKVLRHIDYHFPGKINLTVSPNKYDENPWFRNWGQAEVYITIETAF